MASSAVHRLSSAVLQRRVVTASAGIARTRTFPAVAGGYGRHGGRVAPFSSSVSRKNEHAEETFEEFTQRYEKEFDAVKDVFDLQRNLNNAFAYDLVPSPSVCVAALKAARRVNDFPTAVRIFEGLKAKTENQAQYEEYLAELKPLREELGVVLKEDLFENAAA